MSDAPQGRLFFRRAQRVRRGADFTAARESGRKYDGGWFLVWARARGDENPARLGVSASRAVGGAVVRNRCKRWFRELFRKHQHRVPPGLEVVISARIAMRTAEFSVLEKRLLKILDRLAADTSVQQ